MQKHVNIKLLPGYWPRAKATLSRGEILCTLDYQSAYSLVETYEEEPPPHVKFLNLNTDLDYIRFVSQYGPLSPVVREGGGADAVISIRDCRAFQKYLSTLVTLINAFAASRLKSELLRDALLDCLSSGAAHVEPLEIGSSWKVEFDRASAGDATEFTLGCARIISDDDPRESIRIADEGRLRWWAAAFIENSVAAEAGFRVDSKSRHPKVIAEWKLGSLRDALVWMCWYDVLRKNLIGHCAACGEAFRPTTAHRRKFCNEECSHRVAARNWARKKRRKKPPQAYDVSASLAE